MACQPALDRRCVVRTGITARGRGSYRATYRTVAPAPPVKLADHLAALRIEAGNERGRAVPRVVVRAPLDLARLHRQHGLVQSNVWSVLFADEMTDNLDADAAQNRRNDHRRTHASRGVVCDGGADFHCRCCERSSRGSSRVIPALGDTL